MTDEPTDDKLIRKHRGISAWLTAVLALSALAAVGYRLSIALGIEDTDKLESVLLLPVARQLVEGPAGLYGPFGRDNPLVLIHAPLYYRLAALAAWPLAKAGIDPIEASLAAGRVLAFLGFLTLLLAASKLARIDGATARVGWWTVFMIAGANVFGTLQVAVRPDTLGVAFQTIGIVLILSVLLDEGKSRSAGRIAAAFVAFALAFCVKQHLVAGAAVSAALLLAAWFRGRLPSRAVERAGMLALAVVALIYGLDMVLTKGRTAQAVFLTASKVSQLKPSSWGGVRGIFFDVALWCIGISTLFLAAALALVASRPGWFRRTFAATAGILLVVTMAVFVAQGPAALTNLPLAVSIQFAAPLLLLICALIEPRGVIGGKLDAVLWLYWAAEFVMTGALCLSSTGAWTNYAIQAVVIACVLAARALSRALDRAPSMPWLIPVAVAPLMVLGLVYADILLDHHLRSIEHSRYALVFQTLGHDRRAYFFVDKPGVNRVHGNPSLVYDYWLYPVFEITNQAQRRSSWLGPILGSGVIRYVVATTDSPKIDGLVQTLPELAYHPANRIGDLYVWEHNAPISPR